AKYFKKIYKPTNNNLRISSNSKNKSVDMTLWYKNDDHSGQFGNQRTVNVAAARDKVGKSRKGLRTPRTIRRRCCCARKLSKVFHFKPNSMIGEQTQMKKLMNKNWKHITATWLRFM
nr:hypothetical protein [Tanacetum cinerariifolium]